jgi:hypothetical protein
MGWLRERRIKSLKVHIAGAGVREELLRKAVAEYGQSYYTDQHIECVVYLAEARATLEALTPKETPIL